MEIYENEVLGLVGESGSGKSTLGKVIAGLHPKTAGEVIYAGVKLPSKYTASDFLSLSKDIQMIFQDPYASLNPRMTVWSTLKEALTTRHGKLNHEELERAVIMLMERVGLDHKFIRKYPHEFSGGQRQRIAIARALAPEPKLIIADEPVSALDVSIQSQILHLLKDLVNDLGLTMLFISHDLSVVRYIADRIAVMYYGKIVETGEAESLMENPQHQYTKELLESVPKVLSTD